MFNEVSRFFNFSLQALKFDSIKGCSQTQATLVMACGVVASSFVDTRYCS
jgi:hypothetical protein